MCAPDIVFATVATLVIAGAFSIAFYLIWLIEKDK